MRPLARSLIAAVFAFAFAPLAWAQGWPVKPIRLIVNSAPGGGIVMSPHLYKLGVDVDKDLAPVAPTARLAIFLVVHPSFAVSASPEEFAAHQRRERFGAFIRVANIRAQ